MSTDAKERGSRKVRKGIVVSKSGDKSIIVRAERRMLHPMYGKVVKTFKKYHTHDEENKAKIGDAVTIMETRPLSRTKCWRLVSVQGQEEK